MKKLIAMTIILFLVYFGLQYSFQVFGKGHDKKYEVKDGTISYTIEENFSQNRKQEHDRYFLTIKGPSQTYTIQSYHNFHHAEQIVSEIHSFNEDGYQCILPVFNQKTLLVDIMCKKENLITYYHDLIGENSALDKFAASLESIGYKIENWKDEKGETTQNGPITAYNDHILDHHFVGVNSYRGIYTINNNNLKKVVEVSLLNQDVYERPISTVVNQYYFTADYSQKHDFSYFLLVDLTSNEKKSISYHNRISLDSYIQGVIDNSVYLIDRNNKKQYEIDIKHMTGVEVGNVENGIKIYKDGQWEKGNIYDAIKQNIYFSTYDTDEIKGYDKVQKVGNQDSGFYYLIKKVGARYQVYRADIQNKEQITYLFSTNNLSQIQYLDDYIYFIDGNKIKYYHDSLGVKTLLEDTELQFNNSLSFQVYIK